MNTYTKVIAAVAAGMVCTAVTSQAAVTVVASELNQTLIQASPVAGLGNNDGTISSWVLSGYSSLGYTFVYQVYNNGPDSANSVGVSGFGGGVFVSGAVQATSAGLGFTGTTGTGAFTYNSISSGGTVTFDSSGGQLPVGSYSYFLIVQSDVNYYGPSNGLEQDGFQADGGILAPVPEPTTVAAGALMLLPFGIGALRSLRKDRIA